MLSSVHRAVQRGKQMRIQSLLAYELLVGVAPAKIISIVIVLFDVMLVSSPNIIVTKK